MSCDWRRGCTGACDATGKHWLGCIELLSHSNGVLGRIGTRQNASFFSAAHRPNGFGWRITWPRGVGQICGFYALCNRAPKMIARLLFQCQYSLRVWNLSKDSSQGFDNAKS